jgi:hypothetical protein
MFRIVLGQLRMTSHFDNEVIRLAEIIFCSEIDTLLYLCHNSSGKYLEGKVTGRRQRMAPRTTGSGENPTNG